MPSILTPKRLQRLLGKTNEVRWLFSNPSFAFGIHYLHICAKGAQFRPLEAQIKPFFVFKFDHREIEELIQIVKK
jgi:hypothetical protein